MNCHLCKKLQVENILNRFVGRRAVEYSSPELRPSLEKAGRTKAIEKVDGRPRNQQGQQGITRHGGVAL